jgi:hypothetical protein
MTDEHNDLSVAQAMAIADKALGGQPRTRPEGTGMVYEDEEAEHAETAEVNAKALANFILRGN